MKNVFKLILVVLLMVTFINPHFVSAYSNKPIGILYNSSTAEKLEDVSITNFKLNKNEVSMILKGTKTIPIEAKFIEQSKIDGQKSDLYYAKSKDYEINITVIGDIVAGKFKKADLSPNNRLKLNYDEFSFVVSLNASIDLNEALDGIQKNTEVRSISDSNKDSINNKSNIISLENLDVSPMATTYSAYVNASSGSNVAEATASYILLGAGFYRINTITYMCTQSFLPTNHAYISVFHAPSDTNATWMSSVSNKTTTANVNISVASGSAMVAQTGKMGFVKLLGYPIPWFIDDFDIWYF